jgi:transcriptional regulator with XRE-family HTH domain
MAFLYHRTMARNLAHALMPKLRELRLATGVTLEEAAERVDVHPTTLSRWERGERQSAGGQAVRELVELYAQRAEQARAIADGLGV